MGSTSRDRAHSAAGRRRRHPGNGRAPAHARSRLGPVRTSVCSEGRRDVGARRGCHRPQLRLEGLRRAHGSRSCGASDRQPARGGCTARQRSFRRGRPRRAGTGNLLELPGAVPRPADACRGSHGIRGAHVRHCGHRTREDRGRCARADARCGSRPRVVPEPLAEGRCASLGPSASSVRHVGGCAGRAHGNRCVRGRVPFVARSIRAFASVGGGERQGSGVDCPVRKVAAARHCRRRRPGSSARTLAGEARSP